jgi:hypothetical protein
MNVDSRSERNEYSPGWMKEQLRALAAVEPPRGLRERLRAGVPCRAAREAALGRTRRWLGVGSWAGIAATIVVLSGVVWLHTPAGPSARSLPDANSGLGQMLAADYNSVRPADINALDSNSFSDLVRRRW